MNLLHTLHQGAAWVAPVVSLMVNLLIQSTILIALGLLLARAVRRKGAAVQSSFLRAVLVAVLLSPVASHLLDRADVAGLTVHLPTPEQPGSTNASTLTALGNTDLALDSLSINAPDPVGHEPSSAHVSATEVPYSEKTEHRANPMRSPETDREQESAPDTSEGTHSPTLAATDDSSARPPEHRSIVAEPGSIHTEAVTWSILAILYTGFMLLWMTITGGMLVRLLVSQVRLSRIRRVSRPADSYLVELCRASAQRISTHLPEVRVSPLITSPCLTGVVRPVILLPDTARFRNGEMRRVILHELAHLRRADCFWNLLSRLTTAALFFQPLVWRLARRIERLSDEVCDDYVVQHEHDRNAYARQLVDLAERLTPHAPELTLGVGVVAFRSKLGQRVARILDTSRGLSLRTGGMAVIAIALVTAGATLASALIDVSTKTEAIVAAATPGATEHEIESASVGNDSPGVSDIARFADIEVPGPKAGIRLMSYEYGDRKCAFTWQITRHEPVQLATHWIKRDEYGTTWGMLDHCAAGPEDLDLSGEFQLLDDRGEYHSQLMRMKDPVPALSSSDVNFPAMKGDVELAINRDARLLTDEFVPLFVATYRKDGHIIGSVIHAVRLEHAGISDIIDPDPSHHPSLYEQANDVAGSERALRARPGTATVTGRVLDRPDFQHPIAGASVTLWDAQGHFRHTTTDREGNYFFTHVSPGDQHKVWIESAPGAPAGIWSEHVSLPPIDTQDIRADDLCHILPQGITGRVIDDDTGEPVAGARLNFSTHDKNRDSITTNDEGRYWIYTRPRTVRIQCEGTFDRYYGARIGHAAEAEKDREVVVPPGRHLTDIDFRIDSAPLFSGHVTLEDGSPARNIDVHVSVEWSNGVVSGGLRDAGGTGNTFRMKSDDEGRFKGYLRRPTQRDWEETIEIKAVAWWPDRTRGGVTRAETKTPDPEPGPLDITLKPAATVTLRVVDPDGNPIEDAEIIASDRQMLFNPHYTGPVKHLGDGRYRMTHLIPGLDYHVTARADGYRTEFGNDKTFTPAASESVDAGTLTLSWSNREDRSPATRPAESSTTQPAFNLPATWDRDDLLRALGDHLEEQVAAIWPECRVDRKEDRLEIHYHTAEQEVIRPASKTGGTVTRNEVGPLPDGLHVTIYVDTGVGQALRPQMLVRDPWKTYLDMVHVEQLGLYVNVNTSFGPDTDRRKLEELVWNPQQWLKAIADKQQARTGDEGAVLPRAREGIEITGRVLDKPGGKGVPDVEVVLQTGLGYGVYAKTDETCTYRSEHRAEPAY